MDGDVLRRGVRWRTFLVCASAYSTDAPSSELENCEPPCGKFVRRKLAPHTRTRPVAIVTPAGPPSLSKARTGLNASGTVWVVLHTSTRGV